MEPLSNQDLVNKTRAMEALSPWLNHPRATITMVEGLVLGAAELLLIQLILGPYRRRRHYSIVNAFLRASSKLMNPLIFYTFGTMQATPITNSSYPVWAAFLILASAGTSAFRQYDFYDSSNKLMKVLGDYTQDFFNASMFLLLIDPNTYTLKTFWDLKRKVKNARASSKCVFALVSIVVFTKFLESSLSVFLERSGYRKKRNHSRAKKKWEEQDAQLTEENANDRECDSDPRSKSMKGYNYAVYSRLCRLITIDQIWDRCGRSANGKVLKDMCLSCALFQRLLRQRYFGVVYPKTSLLEDHKFVFKKLLPSDGDFKRAFTIIEVEMGFFYDFFFTKYHLTFEWINLPVPFIQYLIFLKMIAILIVLVLAIRKSLVLETPNPIIEVRISKVDYIITVLVLCVALIVELVQITVYLASNWAQVSLGCMYVKNYWWLPNASIIETVIGILKRYVISVALRNKMDQRSVVFGKKLLNSVQVSDAVKRAVARSLISTYGNKPTTNGQTSLWQNQMFDEYSWALGFPLVEVMLIWHIATEYCDISSPTPSSQNTRSRCSKHRSFAYHFFGYVQQLLPNHGRNGTSYVDIHRGVAVHLSRYCAYLIESVPELLPYREADIAELLENVMEERTELFGSLYKISMIYGKMRNLEAGTKEEGDCGKIFEKGIRLGKQLERMADGDRWEVLEDFWAETIIHAAKSPDTTKQHMQHLENGGEFLTHIWALLAHAGILSFDMGKEHEGPSTVV